MAIVKIFPNDPKKSDFSIRFFATKFHLFEGDKILRSNLKSVEEAEGEMNKIVAERIKVKLPEVQVFHNGFDPETKELAPHKRNHTYALKKCEVCGEEFKSIRSNHVYCSRPCANNLEARLKRKSKHEKNNTVNTDESDYVLKEPFGYEDPILQSLVERNTQKTFDELGKQAQIEKKRENFVSDLLDCIALQVEFEVKAGKIDWDYYYKGLIRLNLVYFNGVNMFTALTEIFGVDGYKKPIVLSSILNPSTLENAKKQGVRFLVNMNTFPSHAQHSALASLCLNKVVIQNFILKMKNVDELDTMVKQLTAKLSSFNEFNAEVASNLRSNSNSLSKLNTKIEALESMNNVKFTPQEIYDPLNREEPIIRDYMKEEEENKVSWWKKMFKL
jgi:hypothetical protein